MLATPAFALSPTLELAGKGGWAKVGWGYQWVREDHVIPVACKGVHCYACSLALKFCLNVLVSLLFQHRLCLHLTLLVLCSCGAGMMWQGFVAPVLQGAAAIAVLPHPSSTLTSRWAIAAVGNKPSFHLTAHHHCRLVWGASAVQESAGPCLSLMVQAAYCG